MIDTKKFISTFVCIFIAGMTMAAPAPRANHKPSKAAKVVRTVNTIARVATGHSLIGHGHGGYWSGRGPVVVPARPTMPSRGPIVVPARPMMPSRGPIVVPTRGPR